MSRTRITLTGAALFAVAFSGVLSTAPMATAATGSGGVPGGNYGEAGTLDVKYAFFDDPNPQTQNIPQGWGQNSTNWFLNATKLTGTPKAPLVNQACNQALNQANQRGIAEGRTNVKSRVVGLMWAVADGDNGGLSARSAHFFYEKVSQWRNGGYQGIYGVTKAGGFHTRIAAEADTAIQQVSGKPNDGNAYGEPFVEVICVALNDGEPKGLLGYDLTVSTDHASVVTTAGQKDGVSDVLHIANNGGKTGITLNAEVVLNYEGPESNKAATKNVQIPVTGDFRTPEFTPADFGWTEWPATGEGKTFWFDVRVPKQDQMKNAVDTADRDPRESFAVAPTPPTKTIVSADTGDELADTEVLASGMFYNARIAAHSNGYESEMTITDTINTEDVVIGGRETDNTAAVKVLDPTGQPVAATIDVSRSGGKTVVSGTVENLVSGTYTLVVPTYAKPTGADYSIPDDSKVCYGAAKDFCLTGNSEVTRKVTPTPDKVWTLDATGALAAQDTEHTNQVAADNKVFIQGSPVSAVVNDYIPANLTQAFTEYSITDDWSDGAKYIDFTDASTARVYMNGTDVTADFTVANDGSTTVATAKPSFLARTKGLTAPAQVKLIISGTFKTDYRTDNALERMENHGSVTWNNESRATNTPAIYTFTPKPDKAWVLDGTMALSTSDKDWTNNVGADNKVFLMDDRVGAVVNTELKSGIARDLKKIQIVDDWGDGAQYVDFSDASTARVYVDGKDVTSQFDVVNEGTITTATAKQSFLDTTGEMDKDIVIKLVLDGKFRTDYDTNGELVKMVNKGFYILNDNTYETNVPPVFTWTPDPHKQVVGSAEEDGAKTFDNINGMNVLPGQVVEYNIQLDLNVPDNQARGIKSLAVKDTFDPMLTPNMKSVEVIDSRTHKPIAGKNYTVELDEANHTFTLTFTPEFIEANTTVDAFGAINWDDNATFSLRFTGEVKMETEDGHILKNKAWQLINGIATATEIPEVKIPPITPKKEDLSVENVDINGKTVVEGDILRYRLTMDAIPQADLAYHVHKLGMIDDYDEEYLEVLPEAVSVVGQTSGNDVTNKFNIQVKDGVVYVFAKQVDSVNYWGQTVKGDPQPEDLKAYDEAKIVTGETPIIDQTLLDEDYYVIIDAKVIKEEDGYTIVNQARQNFENVARQTNIVSNPLKDIDPVKDVVVDESTKDKSIDSQEVKMNTTFNYRLKSSEIPANRAYGVKDWGIADTFDPKHDNYTGIWAVYADTDIYDGDTLLFKAGDLLTDSVGHEGETVGPLFDVTWDKDSYTFTVTANDTFERILNTRGDLPQQWSAYVKMERIAPSEKVVNVFDETYNGKVRRSNEVWTHTPENPAIDVEKFTLSEGWEQGGKGDRDNVDQAFELTSLTDAAKALRELEAKVAGENAQSGDAVASDAQSGEAAQSDVAQSDAAQSGDTAQSVDNAQSAPADGVKKLHEDVMVGFTVTNTGDVDLKNVILSDATHDGTTGSVNSIMCEIPVANVSEADAALVAGADGVEKVVVEASRINVLKVGESVSCVGVLTGVEPGTIHSDTATVTGESVFTGKKVEDKDDWNAKNPSTPGLDVEKFALAQGWEQGAKGDHDTSKDSLELTVDNTIADSAQLADASQSGKDVAQSGDIAQSAPADAAQSVDVAQSGDVVQSGGVEVNVNPEKGTAIAFDVTNTGDVVIKDAVLTDMTWDYTTGSISDFYIIGEDGKGRKVELTDGKIALGDMAPGQVIRVVGLLTGVEPGTAHADTATVTGTSIDGRTLEDRDDFHAWVKTPEVPEAPQPPVPPQSNEGQPKTPGKGAVTGEGHGESNWLLALIGAALAGAGGFAGYRTWARRNNASGDAPAA